MGEADSSSRPCLTRRRVARLAEPSSGQKRWTRPWMTRDDRRQSGRSPGRRSVDIGASPRTGSIKIFARAAEDIEASARGPRVFLLLKEADAAGFKTDWPRVRSASQEEELRGGGGVPEMLPRSVDRLDLASSWPRSGSRSSKTELAPPRQRPVPAGSSRTLVRVRGPNGQGPRKRRSGWSRGPVYSASTRRDATASSASSRQLCN